MGGNIFWRIPYFHEPMVSDIYTIFMPSYLFPFEFLCWCFLKRTKKIDALQPPLHILTSKFFMRFLKILWPFQKHQLYSRMLHISGWTLNKIKKLWIPFKVGFKANNFITFSKIRQKYECQMFANSSV